MIKFQEALTLRGICGHLHTGPDGGAWGPGERTVLFRMAAMKLRDYAQVGSLPVEWSSGVGFDDLCRVLPAGLFFYCGAGIAHMQLGG